MRTVLALLLLAVAANCYVLKMGGLKGSWATDVAVTSTVAVDMAAPTISNFAIEEEAEDYMVNATEGVSYDSTVYFEYDSTDASTDEVCYTVSQMWDETGEEVVAEFYVYDFGGYISTVRYLPQGEYVTTISCSDPSGNSNWWDSATTDSLYSIVYSDHTPDTTPFIVDNVEVDDQTGAITYAIVDGGSSDIYYITFDYETDDAGTDPFDESYNWGGAVTGSWTPSGGSTEQMTWDATCSGYSYGTCTAAISVSIDSEPGIYSISGAMVWDQAGNEGAADSFTPLTITLTESTSTHTQTVVSCQTLVLTDATNVPDVSTISDSFSVTLGCTLKDDVISAQAWIYYIKEQQIQNGPTTYEDGGRMSSNAADVTTLNSLDGSLVTDIDIPGGYPAGPYSLQEVTTRTSNGMSQTYTLDLGSASSAAPSVAALLVAAAVALLRL